MPLVVHYWADLQSVQGLRCYGNITRTRNVNECMLALALCLVALVLVLSSFWATVCTTVGPMLSSGWPYAVVRCPVCPVLSVCL